MKEKTQMILNINEKMIQSFLSRDYIDMEKYRILLNFEIGNILKEYRNKKIKK